MDLIRRPAGPGDWSYISDCIRRGLKTSNPYAKGLSNEGINQLLAPILATFDANIWCPYDAQSAIVAFTVTKQPNIVAWVHVRAEFSWKVRTSNLLQELDGDFLKEPISPLMNRHNPSGFRPWLFLDLKPDAV